ncbi:hypothetical protein [Streptomyces sp. NPDC001530]
MSTQPSRRAQAARSAPAAAVKILPTVLVGAAVVTATTFTREPVEEGS